MRKADNRSMNTLTESPRLIVTLGLRRPYDVTVHGAQGPIAREVYRTLPEAEARYEEIQRLLESEEK